MEDAFLNLNYSPVHLLSTMYQEASVTENYYLSPVNVLRCDVSPFLRTELSKIINVPFNCCGFLKMPPLGVYPIHVDSLRIAAINMPLFENTLGFNSFIFINNKLEAIEYKTNNFTVLNVMKPHGVKNESTEKERIILSIGFRNHSYNTLKELYYKRELINVVV